MNNIQNKVHKSDCCGCTACMAVCNHNAIKMVQDEEGFLYPVVDETLCRECGLCTKVCPSNDLRLLKLDKCFAVKRTDRGKLMTSTSGGFAAALSEKIINDGGIVYGVAYSEFPHVATIRVDNLTDAERLKGSKYVQTDIQNTFREASEDLKQGKKVLFTGTSCHINGLLNYIEARKLDSTNLVTIDLVCHGVPSPKLFEEYIGLATKKIKSYIVDYQHRNKDIRGGWTDSGPVIVFENGKIRKNTPYSDAYARLFYSRKALRPFCHKCPYAGTHRVGDFTIGDYNGLLAAHPDFFNDDGVSLVFTNTHKAETLFAQLKGIDFISSTFEKAAAAQDNLHAPTPKNQFREQFWDEYQEFGIEYVLKKYCGLSHISIVKWYIKKILRFFHLY